MGLCLQEMSKFFSVCSLPAASTWSDGSSRESCWLVLSNLTPQVHINTHTQTLYKNNYRNCCGWKPEQTSLTLLGKHEHALNFIPVHIAHPSNFTLYFTPGLLLQIDGSTLRTICMQHGPLLTFHLGLTQGTALIRYGSKQEAAKAQSALHM